MSEWLTLSQTAGTGNATITITASTYDELQNRVRTLTASTITKKKTVTVRQYSRDGETISVSPIILNYGYLGNDIYTVTVTSDYDWTIECSPWLSTNILSGSGNGTFTVKADPNAGGDRTGFVRVSTRDITVTITANQDANVQLDLYAMFVYSGASASLFYTKENVYKIRVDGGEWFSPASTSYNFGTEGEHFVDVTFRGDYTNSIPPMLCSGRTNLVRVFIPNGYYEIHERAFEDCDNIYELSFGDTIYKIDDYAFSRINRPYSALTNDQLENIVFGNGLEEIREYAFAGRPSLKTLSFNNQLKTIGHRVFYYCHSIESINVPSSVELIGGGAFENCTSLSSVTLNYGLKYIGMAAFDMCAFSSIIIPNSVKRVDYGASETAYAHSLGEHGSFSRCYNLTDIILPNSIEGSLLGTFYDCHSLTSCTLSNNINRIGAEAFYGCDTLYDIIIPNSVEYIGHSTFQSCRSLQTITIPNSVKEIDSLAFANMTGLTKCYIGSGVTAFTNSYADSYYDSSFGIFSGCTKLKNIISSILQEPTYIHFDFNGEPDNDYTPVIINPSAVSDTFKGVATGGTLYHPSGSDYSNWMDTKQYMLGNYGWNENTDINAFEGIILDKYAINITGTGVVQLTIYCNTVWTIYRSNISDDWAIYSQRSGNGNTVITISFPNEPSDVNERSGYYNILTGGELDLNRDSVKLYITQHRTTLLP